MPRFSRQALVVTMLILYGSVSLCGSGLHALADTGISHSSPNRDDQGTRPTLTAVSGHCAICEYQAQGQLAVEPALVVSRPHTSPHVALILALVSLRDRHPSCSPRAPPIALATVA